MEIPKNALELWRDMLNDSLLETDKIKIKFVIENIEGYLRLE